MTYRRNNTTIIIYATIREAWLNAILHELINVTVNVLTYDCIRHVDSSFCCVAHNNRCSKVVYCLRGDTSVCRKLWRMKGYSGTAVQQCRLQVFRTRNVLLSFVFWRFQHIVLMFLLYCSIMTRIFYLCNLFVRWIHEGFIFLWCCHSSRINIACNILFCYLTTLFTIPITQEVT